MPQATDTNDQDSAAPASRSVLDVLRGELGLIGGVITTALFFTVGKEWLADLSSLTWLGLMFAWLFG
ncbi:MAG TPA: hypothetical protein DDW48_07745, partial [Methyloceanibacter sp.]|nr:hypothetical protein [Methyloceanibacter sp.]